jgi:Arylsulfotransferase (ASST)
MPRPFASPPFRAALNLRVLAAAAVCALAVAAGTAGGGPGAAQAASVGPTCTPAQLDGPQVAPGTSVQVSPAPGVRDAPPATQISFLGAAPNTIGAIKVSGSRSGAHAGRLQGYSQGDGASFVPSTGFTPGETVSVSASIAAPSGAQALAYQFVVAYPDVIPNNTVGTQPDGGPNDVQSFQSRPDLRPAEVTLTAPPAPGAGGYIFIAPYSGPGDDGPMILDTAGHLVWSTRMRPGIEAADFQVQQYRGQSVLTWWQGFISNLGFGLGADVIYDSSYHQIAQVRAGNGYKADLHDLRITPQGTALITVYNPIFCNLSAAHDTADGAVSDSLFEEIDISTGLVRQEWHSLDHIPLSDTHQTASSNTKSFPLDYFHINSVDTQPDGSLLVSARSTWAVYDLAPHTGQIVWRLGGKSSSFVMGPGTATAWQHDARSLPDGTISIFDNGSTPTVEPQSRAIDVRIDRNAGTATLVRALTHTAPLVSGSQGNAQALGNGDTFVGWGSQPYFTEYGPTGALVLDGHMPHGDQSYRTFRANWSGLPPNHPAVAARHTSRGLIVYASFNGATGVASWRVLVGSSSGSLKPLTVAPWHNFETAIHTSSNARYVAVEALDATGHTLGRSHTIRP